MKKRLIENLSMGAPTMIHVVRKGEYVSKIISNYNMSLKDFKNLNPQVKDLNKIFVAQELVVIKPVGCDDAEAEALGPAFKKAIQVMYTLIAMSAFPSREKAEEFEKIMGAPTSDGRKTNTEYRASSGADNEYMGNLGDASRRKIGNFSDQIEPLRDQYFGVVKGLVKKCPRLLDDHDNIIIGYELAAAYFLRPTAKVMGDTAQGATFVNSTTNKEESLFGWRSQDIFNMSLLELAAAYGVDVLPKGDVDGFIKSVVKIEKQIRESLLTTMSPLVPYAVKKAGFDAAIAKFKQNPTGYGSSVARDKVRGVKESKASALDKYISENKQLLKENPRNTPEYDSQRRANSYLNLIENEIQKVVKPFKEIKKLIDAMPEWVEKQIPNNAWENLGYLHDLSKINFDLLAVDFNKTVGPGSEMEDIEGQENVVGAIDNSIKEIVADEVNMFFNELPDGSPFKNRKTALSAMAEIKKLVSEDVEISVEELRAAVQQRRDNGGEVSDKEVDALLRGGVSIEELEAAGITVQVNNDDGSSLDMEDIEDPGV
jgi:LysM repeat protein